MSKPDNTKRPPDYEQRSFLTDVAVPLAEVIIPTAATLYVGRKPKDPPPPSND